MTLTYIIPPYLLNTCLGSELQNRLAQKDQELSVLNVISTGSKYYHNHVPSPGSDHSFSKDPVLNDIIKLKIFYKLLLLGVLGNSPSEINVTQTLFIYDYYQIFEDRLLLEEAEWEKSEASGEFVDEFISLAALKGHTSIFSSAKDGEIVLRVPPGYAHYMNLPLKQLLQQTKLKENRRFDSSSSFLKFDDASFFEYPLPLSWTPLIETKYLDYLTDAYNLKVECDSGYSTITMNSNSHYKSTLDSSDDVDNLILKEQESRYYNFVTEKPIGSSTGIYYYEVEVEQEITESTEFLPLIVMNDSSLSSDCSLALSTGFTKRFVNVKPDHTTTSVSYQYTKLDLESLKQTLYNDKPNDVIHILSKPGELSGSYAVNFEDLSFYNSMKSLESVQRTTVLNMNRRLSSLNRTSLNDSDNGKLDIGIPFKTHLITDTTKKKVYKTDIIGCGINFINSSIFITLNGILVKVITQDELASSHSSSNNLFESSKSSDNSVYPIIGFKVKQDSPMKSGLDDSKVQIKSNFGFREFRFNISNYVQNFKVENQRFLYLSLLDKIEMNKLVLSDNSSSVEKSLLNINDDSKMLNGLIKGYLNHQGYLETFKSFNNDLKNLAEETQLNEPIDFDKDEQILQQSHGVNRHVIKKYLMSNQYDNLFKFLKINYPDLLENNRHEDLDISFELKMLKYTFLLKNYIEKKLDDEEFDFEYQSTQSETELYDKAFEYRMSLFREKFSDEAKSQRFIGLSNALLVKDSEGLKNLPGVVGAFQNYSKHVVKILAEINERILKKAGFSGVSNLELIFESVAKNIKDLSFEVKDDKFMLVNFERDHMDL
ncbi:uncharacterized protein CANTADRAFT_91011 [Suhomyces tanzawaensis NRRL Y-17324]|uniref:Uncharacterized protein n=1 Tax=Suhomyces tanzawaensis NRRL Y-17324 TaxID=984487 RepID=A0A1E4SGR7_9ASCO|nr:uncharacterized protein CANTADRAFT_91011 [Suhomyces tanzawaensis NRRL Y-17324]ODV78709.1 hypothetical protein CANTADRAFT_91011 [Suhomyces tanzawaensis NRRL Y-17324]